jgi:hypothetical protein
MNVRTLRDPDPAAAANGGQAGAGAVKVPDGPLDGAMLGKLLEGWDPQAAQNQNSDQNSSADGQGEGANADGAGATENTEGQQSTEQGQTGGEQDAAVQQHLQELAELLAKGEVTIGEVKRLKKLIADKGSDREVIERLTGEIGELRQKLETGQPATPPAPTESNPFTAVVKDLNTLNAAKREMYDVLEWCEDNPEGGNRRGQEYTAEQVKQIRREARRGLDIHLPERERQLQTEQGISQRRTAVAQTMKTNHPQFYDRESEVGRHAAEFRNLPEVRGRADADVIGAIMALGTIELTKLENARLAKANGKNGNGAGRPQTTVGRITLAPRPGASAAPANRNAVKESLVRFGKAPTRDAFADVLDKMGPPGGGARK